jgi:acyl carrier protein
MDSKMISEKFKDVILKELNLDDCDINEETTADKVPGWDSLSHINVIIAIENAYNLQFRSHDVLRCKNVGDLFNLVNKKADSNG